MSSTSNSELRLQAGPIVQKLNDCKRKIEEKANEGREIAEDNQGDDDDGGKAEMQWRTWTQSLPPVAFEVARETKELVNRTDAIAEGRSGPDGDDFS